MAQYIDKSALVAEIERRLMLLVPKMTFQQQRVELEKLLSFIDTLEVKEVDIETSARYYLLNEHKSPLNEVFHQADLKVEMQYHEDIENAFKAGFELGLKAQKGG